VKKETMENLGVYGNYYNGP